MDNTPAQELIIGTQKATFTYFFNLAKYVLSTENNNINAPKLCTFDVHKVKYLYLQKYKKSNKCTDL